LRSSPLGGGLLKADRQGSKNAEDLEAYGQIIFAKKGRCYELEIQRSNPMKIHSVMPAVLLVVLAFCVCAGWSQTELVSSNYFPADLEFRELAAVKSERTLTDPASLSGIPDSLLFLDVGFEKYSGRVYDLAGGGTLSIEIVRLKDNRAAYSLLTLLRTDDVAAGPPGNWYSTLKDGLTFSRGDFWVRIHEEGGPADLGKRVAMSVSNRIGQRGPGTPILIFHFPKAGFEASSVRYFLGPKSYNDFALSVTGQRLKFASDMEVAQAQYALQGMKGILSLVSFPTSQLAEQSFENGAGLGRGTGESSRIYLKRTGPMLGILEGSFDAPTAKTILDSLQFSYAIKWIYDKNNRSNERLVWGVPMPILGTVVRSLVLTALLCGLSLFAGVGFAAFRLVLRGYAPGNFFDRPERTEIIRLKIDEN
jgi:hypothetical protein